MVVFGPISDREYLSILGVFSILNLFNRGIGAAASVEMAMQWVCSRKGPLMRVAIRKGRDPRIADSVQASAPVCTHKVWA